MIIGTADILNSIDNYCIETLKIPGIVLMENAALKVIKNIDLINNHSFSLICGSGNNGGDGFAVARHLSVKGKTVEVFLIGSEKNIKGDAKINYDILKNMKIPINKVSNNDDVIELRDSIIRNDVTIDCIFGTGLKREVEGIFDLVISIINENSSYILSIDVPSGLDSNNGRVLGNAVRATKTVSFGLYKKGFLNYDTDKFTGEIIIEDIGIPKFCVDKFHNNEFIMDEYMIRESLIKRDKYSYKGDYGRVLIFAGSKGFTGASYIATEGAIKTGSGLVTLCLPEDIQPILSEKLNEAMTISFEEEEKIVDNLLKSDAVAFGPGMGDNNTTLSILKKVIEKANCPIVIDADGINVLKDNLQVLKDRKNQIIITPHFGEMARLTGLSIEYIKENRIKVAKEFAKKEGIIVLLKGYNTVITDGQVTIINPTGNSAMASGGMGDCLTGMIASFIGQGYNPLLGASMAAYIHGYVGDRLSEDLFCVNATNIIDKIPYFIKELQKSTN